MKSFNVHFEEHGLGKFIEAATFLKFVVVFFLFQRRRKKAENLRWEKFCLVNSVAVAAQVT